MQDLWALLVDISQNNFLAGLALAATTTVVAYAFRVPQRAIRAVQARRALERMRDPTMVPLDALVGPVRSCSGLAVRLFEACNAEAADLYGRTLGGVEPTDLQRLMWSATFNESDWEGQRTFVSATDACGDRPGQPVVEAAIDVLQRGWPRGPGRVWIRGEAGAGKSTALQRLYFVLIGAPAPNALRVPTPVLIQPRNLDPERVRALASAAGVDWLQVFLDTWLKNRRIDVAPELLPGLSADFRDALEKGDVALLLDGYDELHRMGLLSPARSLLRYPFLIGAERPDEDREAPDDAVHLRLGRTWTDELQGVYLRRRWQDRPLLPWADTVLHEVALPGNEWLRNPRHFVFLLSTLEGYRQPITAQVIRRLTQSEAELLELAFDQAWKRLIELGPEEVARVERGAVARRLGQVALATYRKGACERPAEGDAAWRCVEAMTSIVTTSDDAVKIEDPLFLEYFLGRSIAEEVRLGTLPAVRRRWTPVTVATIAARLRKLDGERAFERVRACLHSDGLRDAQVAAEDRRSLTLNLLELAVRIRTGGQRDGARGAALSDLSLERLDLEGADLRRVRMHDCSFNGASLAAASLKEARFERCTFRGSDLTRADAFRATFHGCGFLDGADGLRVSGMQIAEIVLTECDVNANVLEGAGADALHSRYRDHFGQLFNARPQWLLGAPYDGLERAYTEAIRSALLAFPRDRAVHAVDLMAGGSNRRLLTLMNGSDEAGSVGFPNLHVLALDRDTTQLEELAMPRDRFRTWRVQLGGGSRFEEGDIETGVPFAERLADFPAAPRQAELVIGKKAIHELPRALQRPLLAQCRRLLVDGGRLILLADAPGAMTEEGRRRLASMRELILGLRTASVVEAVAAVRAEAYAHAFEGTPADIALFCNLWVMLKDWANDNMHEVASRYFAGRDEIVGWCEEDGTLTLTGEVTLPYRLHPARFNEEAIRSVIGQLERHPQTAEAELPDIARRLLGYDRERLSLLCDFTERVLMTPEQEPTALGVALNAMVVDVDFTGLHPLLAGRPLPRRPGVEFDFPVHVLTFEKRAPVPPAGMDGAVGEQEISVPVRRHDA